MVLPMKRRTPSPDSRASLRSMLHIIVRSANRSITGIADAFSSPRDRVCQIAEAGVGFQLQVEAMPTA
jgi:hypothetical protein